jgi:hypothetical protein
MKYKRRSNVFGRQSGLRENVGMGEIWVGNMGDVWGDLCRAGEQRGTE